MIPQFVDISQWQGAIDFVAYAAWARQWDGIARMAIKATEGIGFVDPSFAANRAKALAAGIDEIYYYHFGRPDLGNNPVDEAKFMHSVVGNVRTQDLLILDYEVASPLATAEWAYAWLAQQEDSYDGKLPGIYASSAYIQERLQDARLSKYPLWLANWQFTPDERPVCPPPWQSYQFVQYTDNATVPGIPGAVDCNIFLGKEPPMPTTVPSGWHDDGHTLTAPNGIPVVLGFRDHVLNSSWDPNNWALEPEQHCDPLEQSNPKLGAGQRQRFRWITLEDTTARGVFEAWTGPELLWYQKQYTALQTQIALLQSQVADLQNQLDASVQAQTIAALQDKIVQAQKDLA